MSLGLSCPNHLDPTLLLSPCTSCQHEEVPGVAASLGVQLHGV